MTAAGRNAARSDTAAPRQREGPPVRDPAAWPALAVALALVALGAVFVAAPRTYTADEVLDAIARVLDEARRAGT